jgi:hypothetical protein
MLGAGALKMNQTAEIFTCFYAHYFFSESNEILGTDFGKEMFLC